MNKQLKQFLKTVTNVHTPDKCAGHPCAIHNASPHHMRSWPMIWRADKRVIERICPCGVGHPDPDDALYFWRIGRPEMTVHGCCGHCHPPEETTKQPTPHAS